MSNIDWIPNKVGNDDRALLDTRAREDDELIIMRPNTTKPNPEKS